MATVFWDARGIILIDHLEKEIPPTGANMRRVDDKNWATKVRIRVPSALFTYKFSLKDNDSGS